MDFKNNTELRDLLAGEFVLGTLRGGARRRFQAMCRIDRDLQQRVERWSEQLAPLLELVPAAAPPERVWRALAERIPEFASAKPASERGFWSSLAVWRGLAVAMTVVAAVSIGWMQKPSEVSKQQASVASPLLFATFSAPDTKAPLAVAMMDAQKGEVMIKVVAPDLQVPPDKTLQLWMVRPGSDALISVGVAPHGGMTTMILPAGQSPGLGGAKALGLSLEPLGGSPQPTHALGFGAWSRLDS
jgi:anti-sigma-K factor RskA